VSSLATAARQANLLEDPVDALSTGGAPDLAVEHNFTRVTLALSWAGVLATPGVLSAATAQSVHANQLAHASATSTDHREKTHTTHAVQAATRLGPFLSRATDGLCGCLVVAEAFALLQMEASDTHDDLARGTAAFTNEFVLGATALSDFVQDLDETTAAVLVAVTEDDE